MKRYSVVIIGAGPAGSSAAIFMKKIFPSILLIDKAKFPREKLCGGALSEKTIGLLKEEMGLDEEVRDLLSTFSSSTIVYKLNKERRFDLSSHPIHFVRRVEFDHLLVKVAIERGIEFKEGTRVVSIDNSTGEIVLSDGSKVFAEIIIGADGFPSTVAKMVGLSVGEEMAEHAMAYEVHIPKDQVPEVFHTEPKLYVGDVSAGYGWIFPKKEVVTVGLAAIKGRNPQLRAQFLQFLKFLNIEEVPKIQGHWVPSSLFQEDIVSGRTFLIGDAAKFADPLIGEGIYYAILSAKLLAKSFESTLINFSSLEKVKASYIELCKKEIGEQFKYAYRIRELIAKDYVLKKCMDILDVDKIIAQDLILMMNGYMSFRKFWYKSWMRSPIFTTKLLLSRPSDKKSDIISHESVSLTNP